MTRYAWKFRRIARALSRAELMRRSMNLTFTLDDVDPAKQDEDRRFLDFYSEEGLWLGLREYGFMDALSRRGYEDLKLETNADDQRHTLLLTARVPDVPDAERLMELVVRRDQLVGNAPVGVVALEKPLETLTVDWLSLRHPRGRFTADRPRLPGQDAPGLGLGERVLELLYQVTIRLGLDTLINVPQYFHNAVLYARELPFLDPWYAGQLDSMEQTLMRDEGLSLSQASWAIHWGHVRRHDGSVFKWRGQVMIWPHEDTLKQLVSSAEYRAERDRVREHERYTLDRAAFDAHWAEEVDALCGAD